MLGNDREKASDHGTVTRSGRHSGWKALIIVAALLIILCLVFLRGFFLTESGTQNFIGTEKGSGLSGEEANQILLSDLSEEDWEIFDTSNEKLSQVISEYSDEDGYIEEGGEAAVINAVAAEVDRLYKEGIVACYTCDESGLSFEYACGLTAFYSPKLDGEASGGDKVDIVTIEPFESYIRIVDGQEENVNIDSASVCAQRISEALSGNLTMRQYTNEEVTLNALQNLPECEYLFWDGHGHYIKSYGSLQPILVTRESTTGLADISPGIYDILTGEFSLSLNDVACGLEDGGGNYWGITPAFVLKHVSMDNGLVYLSTCHSGQNNELANAFRKKGAEVVFVNAGEGSVNTAYTEAVMQLVCNYMCGFEDDDHIFHTAEEALELANKKLDQAISNGAWEGYTSLQDMVNKQNGVHTEIRGIGGYTLCSCIRGTIAFDDSLTETEISEYCKSLSIMLESQEGEVVDTVGVNDDGSFYFNGLEPGAYCVSLFQEGKQISGKQDVKVREHRYTPTVLPYDALVPLEGYVYNERGEPLADVSVSAELKLYPEDYSTVTSTDANGYYRVEVFGSNTYSLSYSLEGYDSVTNVFNVTELMLDRAQRGIAVQIEDQILTYRPEDIYEGDADVRQHLEKYLNETLIPKYGTPSGTGIVKMDLKDYEDVPVYKESYENIRYVDCMDGIYSVYYGDIDADGQEEMCVVRARMLRESAKVFDDNYQEVEGARWNLYEYLSIYEYESGTVVLSDERSIIPTDDSTQSVCFAYDAGVYTEVENGVFLYEYNGKKYFIIDYWWHFEHKNMRGTLCAYNGDDIVVVADEMASWFGDKLYDRTSLPTMDAYGLTYQLERDDDTKWDSETQSPVYLEPSHAYASDAGSLIPLFGLKVWDVYKSRDGGYDPYCFMFERYDYTDFLSES